MTSSEDGWAGCFTDQHTSWFQGFLQHASATLRPWASQITRDEVPPHGISSWPDGTISVCDYETRAQVDINAAQLRMLVEGPVLGGWQARVSSSRNTVSVRATPSDLTMRRVRYAAEWIRGAEKLALVGPVLRLAAGLAAEARLLMFVLPELRARAKVRQYDSGPGVYASGNSRNHLRVISKYRLVVDLFQYDAGKSRLYIKAAGRPLLELKPSGESFQLTVYGNGNRTITLRQWHNILDAVLSQVELTGTENLAALYDYFRDLAARACLCLEKKLDLVADGRLFLAVPPPWPQISIKHGDGDALVVVSQQDDGAWSRIKFDTQGRVMPREMEHSVSLTAAHLRVMAGLIGEACS